MRARSYAPSTLFTWVPRTTNCATAPSVMARPSLAGAIKPSSWESKAGLILRRLEGPLQEPPVERDHGESGEVLRARPDRGLASRDIARHADAPHLPDPAAVAERVLDLPEDGPDAGLRADSNHGLLHTLCVRGPGRDLAAGQRPQSRQEPARRPADEEDPPAALREREAHPHGQRGPAGPGLGGRLGPPLRKRPALRANRTCGTPRGHGPTHGGAEFHEGLVERAGLRGRDEGRRDPAETPLALPAGEVALEAEDPREHARRVPIDGGHRLAERDARDRARGVVADPGQRAKLRERPRDSPATVRDDRLRGTVEVAGADVEAEALPGLQDLLLGGPREVPHGREAGHEPLVVWQARNDARPLEEDLRDEDRVRVARAAEREVPLGLPVPRDEAFRDSLGHGGGEGRATSKSLPRRDCRTRGPTP